MKHGLSHAEYFALERREGRCYEYLGGEVFAMTGGSESHSLIAGNTLAALAAALRGRPCRVYNSDLKVFIAAHDTYCYPDVTVVCDDGRRSRHCAEGPALVVEVLSPTTGAYDRGLKFEHYRAIPELRHYLLLNQERMHAERFARDGEEWLLREAGGAEGALFFAAWEVTLPLAELYRNVDFANADPEPEPADAR